MLTSSERLFTTQASPLVRAATETELSHGHVHGPDGHDH